MPLLSKNIFICILVCEPVSTQKVTRECILSCDASEGCSIGFWFEWASEYAKFVKKVHSIMSSPEWCSFASILNRSNLSVALLCPTGSYWVTVGTCDLYSIIRKVWYPDHTVDLSAKCTVNNRDAHCHGVVRCTAVWSLLHGRAEKKMTIH